MIIEVEEMSEDVRVTLKLWLNAIENIYKTRIKARHGSLLNVLWTRVRNKTRCHFQYETHIVFRNTFRFISEPCYGP